ncbi:hypothetical protein CEXT_254921 [Caerostris extrusa]|uniref:Protein ARV n=1 Tax=Caerostris extrusa TaxID=172846 RepID=A0AAV4P9E5_CAEEX|nr:hypothetical protein CEXT_254921 [Caerostris extrusa]
MCLKSFLEYFIFATLIIVILYHTQVRTVKKVFIKNLFNCIVLASYGKLFMLPVLIWSKDEEYCEILIIFFIFLSQLQIMRVTTNLSSLVIVVLLIGISELGLLFVVNTVTDDVSAAATNELAERAKQAVQRLSCGIAKRDKDSAARLKTDLLLENRLTLWKIYIFSRSLVITSFGTLLTYGILLGTLGKENVK